MNDGGSPRRWHRLLAKVRNKRFWYTLIGLIATIFILYVVEFTFVSVEARQRAIIGTALQLLTGFLIGADQVVANLHFKSNQDLWDLLVKRRMRISLLVCLVLSLVAVLYWLGISEGAKVSPISVYGAIAVLAMMYYPYMYGLHGLIRLLEKGHGLTDPLTKESNIMWGNVILLAVSGSAVVLTGLFVKPEPGQWAAIIWWFLVAVLATPTAVLCLGFLLVAGVIRLFALMRQRVKRPLFWLALLALWSWGGLLLLADVLTR